MSSVRTEVGLHLLDMGGDRRVGQEMDTLSVQTVCLPRLIIIEGGPDNASLCISPQSGEEGVAQRPASHCQLSDDR